jgi:hypothetical protein
MARIEVRQKSLLSATSALSRSVSPFRRFARKLTRSGKSPNAAATPFQQSKAQRIPSSAPTGTLRHRSSLFNLTSGQPSMPTTPDRLGHKYSQSLTPESTPSSRMPDQDASTTIKARTVTPSKQPWNSSTRVDENQRLRRPSVVTPHRPEVIPHPPPVPHQRSVSRSSMASSRPWSPITSSVSTAGSTNPTHPQRPPSRARTPGVIGTSPRARATTPSHIPGPSPSHFRNFSDTPWDDSEPTTSLMQRALSPDHSPPRATTPGGTRLPGPRPPSRSMIPAPVFHILSPSRPGSTLSNYRDHDIDEGGSPTHSHTSFRSAALRAQTPEAMLRSDTLNPARPSTSKSSTRSKTSSARRVANQAVHAVVYLLHLCTVRAPLYPPTHHPVHVSRLAMLRKVRRRPTLPPHLRHLPPLPRLPPHRVQVQAQEGLVVPESDDDDHISLGVAFA